MNVGGKRRVRLAAAGLGLVAGSLALVWFRPGPDPCLPVGCPSHFSWGFHAPFPEGNFSGGQAVVLFGGALMGAIAMAIAVAPRSLVLGVPLAGAVAILLAGSITGSSSLTGPWFDAEGRQLLGTNGSPYTASVSIARGPSHCGWDSVLLLGLRWPLGHVPQAPHRNDNILPYIKDPRGAYADARKYPAAFDGSAQLPADARATGYHRGTWELWVSPSRIHEGVWLKSGSTIEEWPYDASPIGCQ